MITEPEILTSGQVKNCASQRWYPYEMRILDERDLSHMLELYDLVVGTMANPELLWRYDDTVVAKFLGESGVVAGVWADQRLIAFRVLYVHPAGDPENPLLCIRPEWAETAHLALCVVHPEYRGNSLQKKMGGQLIPAALAVKPFGALCSIVSPHNYPSISDKFSLGMAVVKLMPKFKGLWRYIFYRSMQAPFEWKPGEPVFAASRDYPRQIDLLEQGYYGVQLDIRNGEEGVLFRK